METEAVDPLVIPEDVIRRQGTFQEISEEYREGLLGFAVTLANNPGFQRVVRNGVSAVTGARNLTEITAALGNLKRDVPEVEMEDTYNNTGRKGPIRVWLPNGAIAPAIDAVWETLSMGPQQSHTITPGVI